MKKIKMIRTEKGSIDGFTVNKYMVGVEYNLPIELADAFLNIGSAELITETMQVKQVDIETPEKISNEAFENIAVELIKNKDKPETVKKSKRKRKYTKRNK